MSLIYCTKAMQQEMRRTPSERKHSTRAKRSLGLVPVVDGRCSGCGKIVRTVEA